MAFTIEKLENTVNNNKSLDVAITLLAEGDEEIANAIKTKSERGEAIIMAVKDQLGKVVGGSFSIVHNKPADLPAIAMYTYEHIPKVKNAADIRDYLLDKSLHEIHKVVGKNSPVFFEGDFSGNKNTMLKKKASYENRGFTTVNYDNKAYQWDNETHYKWMVHGEKEPLLDEMKAAINLQRAFVIYAYEGKKYVDFKAKLNKQISNKQKNIYEVDKSLQHADLMAQDGKMSLDIPPIGKEAEKLHALVRQVVKVTDRSI